MSSLESKALEMMGGNEKESEQAAIERLASLSPIDYDRTRKEEAQKLGISVSTLDKTVKAVKRYEIDDSGFPNVEPWEQVVNPDVLLNDISDCSSFYRVQPGNSRCRGIVGKYDVVHGCGTDCALSCNHRT